MTLSAEISFDFEDDFQNEKELFLYYLAEQNWINLNSDRNWKIEINNNLFAEDQIDIIKKDLAKASKLSNIKSVDYALILGDTFYFDRIN